MVYADSSVLVAWFWPEDVHGKAVNAWVRENSPELAYNALLRLEVRHALRAFRRTSYGTLAWNGLRIAEASGGRLRGYKVDLLELIQSAEVISHQHEGHLECGSADLIHIAGAMETEALFVTCDVAQAKAARLVNLKCVLLGK